MSSAADDDYRYSHLERGATYDAGIAASPWDDYLARAEERLISRAFAEALPSIGRSLDFACGTGRITRQVEQLVFESWGVDISPTMLERARAKCLRTEFRQIDLTRDTLATGPFDLVTSFRFFGNAQDELRRAALAAMNRLLGVGGWLLVDNHRNPHSLAPLLRRLTGGTHELDLSHRKFVRLLSAAGFEVQWQRPIGAWIWRDGLTGESLRARRPDAAPESSFQHRAWVPVAPAAVIVARKTKDLEP